jgi:RNA polymerase sigma factor (sigma-70 family)
MDGDERSDTELVQCARDGDRRAIGELYDRHSGTVRFVIRDRVRDDDMVDELVQETFTRALERLGNLRQPDRFRSWLLAIARNVATDRWRHERRAVGTDDEVLEQELEPVTSSEDEAARRELAGVVGDALRRLPRRDALALALTAYLDLDGAELGVALGVTPNAAKVIVHRARRRLRTALVADALEASPDLACPGFWREGSQDARQRHVAECLVCVAAARDVFGSVGEARSA